MKIYAHRGYSAKYPENTLVAFRATAELEVEGVEFDVHLTADRQVVVIHDEKINRTSNGSGYVKDMTFEELRQYDYGSWFSDEFAGEVIPTLAEVLDVFKDTNHHINIELKSDIFVYAGLEELVLREVEKQGMMGRVVISSFDHEAVKRVAELVPDVENAALFVNMILDVADYQKKLPAKALHVCLPTAVRKPVLEAISKGSIVRVWTVNDIQYVDPLLQIGVDSIFTDEPEMMLEFLKKGVRK
ncbi:glycerophosphodiester phosphodiesterase [Ureibacillus acetophenoni]|uniref:Glycerophosphoryl diester phosphodiesterase n=1 Tax=Ureibacillus acetophenoni TaxID=614649 RepID=A0A285USR7_9BACL|nr:glycerophosphodiester phosphodiesterase [Ureibacillus acetophenoni]SOC43301.1 glycerophosphoryl diester phosphodiesterase [Ureibacillus acetophenoni]